MWPREMAVVAACQGHPRPARPVGRRGALPLYPEAGFAGTTKEDPMTSGGQPAAAWRRLRIMRWTVWGAGIAWMIAGRLAWGDASLARTIVAVPMVVLLAALLWVLLFRCPRCRHFFHFGKRAFNPLARACVHCQLAVQ